MASASGRPLQLGVIGDFFVDIQTKVPQLPQWDRDTETDAIELLPGGSAANTARQLAALVGEEVPVSFFSTCGDDLLGRASLEQLRRQGFDVSHVKPLPSASSACIILSGAADRAMVSCYSTVRQLTLEHIDRESVLRCSHLHIGGYLGIRGLHTEDFTELVRSLREKGSTVSLGTNCCPDDQWTGVGGHLLELLPHVNVLILNANELEEITKAAGKPLHQLSPGLIIAETRGREGALVHAAGAAAPAAVAPLLAEAPIDVTGAGDAFAAGFLSRWATAGASDPADAARWGNAAARCAVMRSGACREPCSLEEVRGAYERLCSAGP